jgi:hypothetical protein
MASSCTVDDVMAWSRAKAHEMKHELGLMPCTGSPKAVTSWHDTFCNALSGSIAGTLVSYRIAAPPPKVPDGE